MPTNKTSYPQKIGAKVSASTNMLILIYAIVGLIVIVLAIFIGRNLVNNALLNNRVIVKKQTADAQASANLEAVRQLSESYQSLSSIRLIADRALPTTADFPSIVNVMQGIASTSAVKLTNVNPEASASSLAATNAVMPNAPADSTAKSYDFSAQVGGSLTSITDFLKAVELSARPMYVTGISFSGTTPNLQVTVQIRTFYQAPTVYEDKTEVVK